MTKLLTKEDKEARKRKQKLDGIENRVQAEEEQAESLADSALTQRDVKVGRWLGVGCWMLNVVECEPSRPSDEYNILQ